MPRAFIFRVSRARGWLLWGIVVLATCLATWQIAERIAGRRLRPQLLRTRATKAERLILSGSAASHRKLDARGGDFNGGKLTELIIESRPTTNGWDRPEDITLCNGHLRGAVRILGLGRNGQAPQVRASSRELGHTERAQAAAPTQIVISNVTFEAAGGIPLYIAPGVTAVTVVNCTFTGTSSSTAIYLDAESAHHFIRSNLFQIHTQREIIAVDGSASNAISGNRFLSLPCGGIYLYRNCGEGGTIRHQTPHHNLIADNRFDTSSLRYGSYGVWLGSRNGRSRYRDDDAGFAFGSSLDNRDFADFNTVVRNQFLPPTSRDIRNNGKNNQIAQ